MKRFRDIIQDIKAPSTSDLWINNGELNTILVMAGKPLLVMALPMYMFYRVTFKQQKDGLQ